MIFTVIDSEEAWLKFFEYFDLADQIEDATYLTIDRLANALARRLDANRTGHLVEELHEYGDANYLFQLTLDDIICNGEIYCDGSEVVDDSFIEYFSPGDTEFLASVGMTISLTFVDAETDKVLLDLKEIKSKNK